MDATALARIIDSTDARFLISHIREGHSLRSGIGYIHGPARNALIDYRLANGDDATMLALTDLAGPPTTQNLVDLPEGAVIRDRQGRVWEKWGRDTWQPNGLDSPVREFEGIIKMPVQVLYVPEDD